MAAQILSNSGAESTAGHFKGTQPSAVTTVDPAWPVAALPLGHSASTQGQLGP